MSDRDRQTEKDIEKKGSGQADRLRDRETDRQGLGLYSLCYQRRAQKCWLVLVLFATHPTLVYQ